MTKSIKLFDEAVRVNKLGTRLPDDAPERSNGALQVIKEFEDRQIEGFRRSNLCTKPLPRVLVDYVDNPLIGGWAFFHRDSYVLAITTGALSTLRFLCNRLLACPHVFPTVGDAKTEAHDLPVIPLTVNFRDLVGHIEKEGYGWEIFIPKDPVRRNFADFMIFNATLFLMCHEFRHIQAGHVDYGKAALKLTSLQELPFIGYSERDSMACQALELDADNCAMQSLLSVWCRQMEAIDPPVEELQEVLTRRDVFLPMFMVSCCGLFRVFDAIDKPPHSSWTYLSHPPTRIRRLWLLMNVQAFLQAERKERLFGSPGVLDPSLLSLLEVDTHMIWGQGFDETYSATVLSDLGLRHVLEIKRIAKSIGADLAKHSFINHLGEFF